MKKFQWGIRIAVLLLLLWSLWANQAVKITETELSFRELPNGFDGFRIAHVSDLHNAQFGENNETLLKLLRQTDPDIIAVTGDIVDSRRTDTAVALAFLEEAVKIAPCFYVNGNHEARISGYREFEKSMEALGVTVLDNRKAAISRAGQTLTVMGIDDPNFADDGLYGTKEAVTAARIANLYREEDGFAVLLSHRPDLFDTYVDSGVNLVLSGHAHGGQFRLPFVGGLYAPGQGFFPEYDAGVFRDGETAMVVSRGLGNSAFPLRFNNRPEIILLVLSEA